MPEESEPSLFERKYQERERFWGAEPLPSVVRNLANFAQGSVLDLGAGDGRNALYLAKQGFQVVAVDNASTGIGNLSRYAQVEGLQGSVNGIVADIADFIPHGEFDNMISTFTLHFLGDEEFARAIDMMQQHTKSGGVNLIQDFIKGGPPYDPEANEHWLESGELRRTYETAGWIVIEDSQEQHEMMQRDESGRHLTQVGNTLVARKP